MVTEIRNTILSLGSGLSNQIFDLGGVTYQRGPTLGDKSVIALSGTNNVVKNFRIDDSGLSGVSGAVSLEGTDNVIEDAYLDNCIRYGMYFRASSAIRCTYRRITIRKCQHGISGGSGAVGQWTPSVDCVIEDCDISGMQIDGIKLKNMLRTIVRRNKIDVYPLYPEISSKSGIYFAGTDTASKDCIIEDNNIYQSAPTPSGISSSRAILINPDQLTVPSVFSSGNIIRNNTFTDMNTGALIRGSNFSFDNNVTTRVPNPYVDSTYSGYPPPSNNTITVNLSYSSTPVPVDASINGTVITNNSSVPCAYDTSIVISAPRILEETTTINPPVGFGTTIPGPGVYKKLLALDITAYPTIGSELNKWTYDGADHPASNPFKISPQQYKFKHFVVNSIINTPNPLTLTMDNFKSVQSVYELIDMGIVTINGSVSAQVAADQPITIVITKPGGTPVSLPGIKTDVSRNFTTTYSDVAGSYSLVASIAADAQYASASSGVVSFSIALAPRTITVTVN